MTKERIQKLIDFMKDIKFVSMKPFSSAKNKGLQPKLRRLERGRS